MINLFEASIERSKT